MASVEIIEWIIVLCLAQIFTIISIGKEADKSKGEIHYKLIAGLLWFFWGFSNFIVSHSLDGLLTNPLTWLGFGLGFIFVVMAIGDFFEMKRQKIWGFED